MAARRRTTGAPLGSGVPALPAVLSVVLGEDEEVRWVWTHADGASVVTGYDIVQKSGEEPEV